MRMRSPIPKKRARIEIIPLIDIMFFLLASFMMVSLSQVHMKGIQVNLPAPTAVQTQPPLKDFVSIKVDRNGSTLFDGEFVTEDQVMPRLFGLHQQNPDIKVSISAEEQALHGAVITLLDHVRSAGIKKVGYQIKPAVVGP